MSAVSRVQHVDQQFRNEVSAMSASFKRVVRRPNDPIVPGNPLTVSQAVELLESQITSRWVDFVARELKADGLSFYTIGSSGHEGNAMVGMLTHPTDQAYLHYRSGGFFFARARKVAGQTPVFDTALSLTAAKEDPISGGRHKVWGSDVFGIPPQTSTIASHLPKSLGASFFLARLKKYGLTGPFPDGSIVVCSFGDASVNHASATTALNAAAWCAFQHLPLPLLFVCEDNGVGISVRTPENWVESNYRNRAGLQYFQANGLDMVEGFPNIKNAVDFCRSRKRPVFLHLKTVRLLGHAGSDVETNYRTREQIEAIEAMDPVLQTARRLVDCGVLSPEEILSMYDQVAEQVRAAGREAAHREKHSTPETIMAPLRPGYQATRFPPYGVSAQDRASFWKNRLPEDQKPRPLASHINWALQDLFLEQRDLALFGEDVAKKGGVYNVTADMYNRFGVGRVFNTLLDETTILGLAIGAGHNGVLPIPEIQYLAYLHNAIDQLRGEASSLGFFSEGRFQNPMVVRIAGFAYQKGFGGHFHNDNALAALREIPGVLVVTASNGPDAARLLRTSIQLAKQHGAVVAYIEPIALYHTKDLVDSGDFLESYPAPDDMMPFGEVGFYGPEDAETLIITYANGTYLSRQAAADLAEENISVRILDLRFLSPLNAEALVNAAKGRKNVVIVDECRRTGSLSEEITTVLVENLGSEMPRLKRVTGEDTFIPLGPAWECVIPSRESIAEAVRTIAG